MGPNKRRPPDKVDATSVIGPAVPAPRPNQSANYRANAVIRGLKRVSGGVQMKLFVKRKKNDAADAEAIAVAAQRPEMRFVVPKTADQQARAVLFRSRDRLVHQRTEMVNCPLNLLG